MNSLKREVVGGCLILLVQALVILLSLACWVAGVWTAVHLVRRFW